MTTHTRFSAVLAATVLVAGCAAASAPSATVSESPSPVATFDSSAPLDAQMEAAIESDDLSLVEEILAAGYDPGTETPDGRNALHLAAYADASDLVPVLVEAGVPLEEKANHLTPLAVAASFADADTVTAFLEAGADVTATNAALYNALPLHMAARWGNVEGLRALIDWGVPVDQFDPGNSTALIYACYFGQMDAAVFLAENGADLDHMDDVGDTPVVASSRMGFAEIADAMRALGAEG